MEKSPKCGDLNRAGQVTLCCERIPHRAGYHQEHFIDHNGQQWLARWFTAVAVLISIGKPLHLTGSK